MAKTRMQCVRWFFSKVFEQRGLVLIAHKPMKTSGNGIEYIDVLVFG